MAQDGTHKTAPHPLAQRLDWVDATKGLTIILVVVMHTALGTQAMLGHPEMALATLTEYMRPFRVPLFFLIAGLFAAKAMTTDWRRFCDGKLIHFAYFYFLWAGIQLGTKLALPSQGNHAVSLMDIWLLPIEPFATLWFIHALALFFLVARLTRDLPPVVMLALASALYAADLHTGWTAIDEFSARFIYFLLGLHGSRIILSMAGFFARHKTLALGTALLGFTALGAAMHHPALAAPLPLMLAALIGSLSTIAALNALGETKGLRPLIFIGQSSLIVYLAFFLPSAATRILLVRSGWDLSADTIALLAIIMGVALPLLGEKILHGTPLSFLFHRPAALKIPPAPVRWQTI